ncbi:hypothetical protein ACFV27_18440 [Streptomyces antimycoticus]|uniref:hypothetical protein n=1 Tax=Streptomyces antimycoticus TaxID=68175 RepID=UPI0036A7A9BB
MPDLPHEGKEGPARPLSFPPCDAPGPISAGPAHRWTTRCREDKRLDVRVADGRLTPQGAALRERTRTVPPAIGDAIGLGDDEIKTAQELLRRLTANVEQHASGKGKGKGNGNSSAGSGPAESTP